MEIKARPITVLTFGCGLILGFAALVLLISGRDFSPSESVAEAPHSVVNMSSDSAWQSNRAQLDRPGPEQVIVQQPPTVIVQLPEGVYPPAADSSVSGELSASDTGADGTGWRTPSATTTNDNTEQSSSNADSYTEEFRTQPPTNDQPSRRECMLAADDIVANGWHNSPVEVSCFGSEDNLAGINDAYGALESESGKGSATNPHPGYSTCASEDSPGPCAWDARVQGNGVGHNFLREADGTVTYLN